MSITINEAIEAGIELIENPTWRKDQYCARRNGWNRWHSEKRPDLRLWTELLPGHVHEFHRWLYERYRPATVNNYMNPIRKAATWIKLYKPDLYRDLFTRNVIRAKHRPASKRFLMPDQLAAAIGAARDGGEPNVVAALMFGGLAGLDIGEITRITGKDIKDGLLHVRGEKNEYRPRIIPMCQQLGEFAYMWKQLYSRYGLKTEGAVSHKARLILNDCAKATGDSTFTMVTLHDCTRVTFINTALHGGADKEYLKAYVGHAPESVLAKHYGDLTPRDEDMPRVLDAKVEQLQKRVVVAVEKNIESVSFFT